jgi:hypothetical protein
MLHHGLELSVELTKNDIHSGDLCMTLANGTCFQLGAINTEKYTTPCVALCTWHGIKPLRASSI